MIGKTSNGKSWLLQEPFFITSRGLIGLEIDGIIVSVDLEPSNKEDDFIIYGDGPEFAFFMGVGAHTKQEISFQLKFAGCLEMLFFVIPPFPQGEEWRAKNKSDMRKLIDRLIAQENIICEYDHLARYKFSAN